MGAQIDRLEIEVEAAAAKANKELEKLISGLEKVAGSLAKIDTSNISGFSSGLKDYTSNTKSAEKETKAASKSLDGLNFKFNKTKKSFAQMAGSFYSNYFLIIRGIKKLSESVTEAMDYVETYNYFSVTMDKIGKEFAKDYEKYGADSADAYADSFKTRLNQLTEKMTGYSVGSSGELTTTDSIGLALDPEAVMNFQSSIAAVTNSVGLVGENSVNASKALTMLAADMSSLKNIDLSTAMTNFQSGLIGQSRALYKYGIDITNATLQTYAYDLGLSKTVSEMTQAEKMQLRLIAILDQSKVAWGDAANTINSVANQYRIMKQQISNLARVIGNLFLPIVQKVLPVVNGLMIALQRLFSVLGFKLWGGNWLKDTMDGISGVGNSAFDDVEDSTGETADNLADAGKAAEKLKNMVRGIDELNIISQDTDTGSGSSGSAVGGGIDLSGAIGDALAEYESVWEEAFKNAQNKAQEFADKIYEILKPIEKLFSDIIAGDWFAVGEDVSNIVSGIFNFFAKAISKVDWHKIGYNIGSFIAGINWIQILGSIGKLIWESLTAAIDLWKGAFDAAPFETAIITAIAALKFSGLWKAIAPNITTVLYTGFSGIFLSTIGTVPLAGTPAFDVIANSIVDGISNGLKKILPNGVFDLLNYALSGAVVGAVAGSWFPGIGQIVGAIVGSLVGALVSQWPLITEWWNSTVVPWWNETIVAFWDENIAPWFTAEKWTELLNGILEGFAVKWDELRVWWSESAIVTWWNEDVTPWFNAEKWTALYDTIKTSLKTKWDETAGQWAIDVKLWWNEHVAPWFTKEKWLGLGENLKNGIYEGFKGLANKVVDVLNDVISGLESMINNAISGINELLSKISSSGIGKFVSELTGFSFQIGTVAFGRIPHFAEGGFPETGQLFLARENGLNEMVGHIGNRSAVANNDQIVEGVKQGVYEAVLEAMLMMRQQNSEQTIVVETTVEMDGKAIVQQTDKARRRMGYSFQQA